jgi:hypothetical protein
MIMGKFRDRIARFFYGRYGADQLYNAMFIAELVCLFAGAVLGVLGKVSQACTVISVILYALAMGLLVLTMLRFFSRNIAKRQKENAAYLRIRYRILHPVKSRRAGRPADTATHVFRACPKCKSVLRLPRQVGKHTAKCPRCEKRFTVKVKK